MTTSIHPSKQQAVLFSRLHAQAGFFERIRPRSDSTLGRAYDHLRDRFAHRDRGSQFGRKTAAYAWLPYCVLIPLLQRSGRDGLLVRPDEQHDFIASCFFHVHRDNSVHSFAYFCHPDFRGKGYGRTLACLFLNHARDILDFSDPVQRPPRVRIYGGNSQAMDHVFNSLAGSQGSLGVRVLERQTPRGPEKGWLEILSRESVLI